MILIAAALPTAPLRATDPPAPATPTTRPAGADPEERISQPDQAASRPANQPIDPLEADRITLAALDRAFADLFDRLAPSVVAIEADRRPNALSAAPDDAASPWISAGAGVVIRADGRILTCQHLIDGASALHVILHDGRRLTARKIAEDRRSDLAVIRAEHADLPPAPFEHDVAARRGQWAVAFGDPLGLARDGHLAAVPGTIAAVNRPLPPTFGRDEDRYYGDLIQTTAPAGPGSSGGPLFSLQGRVIGIVAAVPTRTGDASPFAFAVPINDRTLRIIDALVDGRAVEHGYLGVEVDLLSNADRERANLPTGTGVRIASVFADGPADQAGLARGDIVTRINDAVVLSVDDFVGRIGAHSAGSSIRIDIIRGQSVRSIDVKLTRRPPNPEQSVPEITMNFRGAALGRVDETTRTMSNLPDGALLVIRVDAGSPAERAGLTPGEVIIRANGATLSPDAATRLLNAPGDVMLGLANGGAVVVKP